ncbi:hypothetical protein M973_07965 [Francisella orientalis LADL 07-285A]|nr:hypothetical protein M973_07965 [Francisella orientalis LADL 07-285A]
MNIVLGGETKAQCPTKRVFDGDILTFGNYKIKAIYAPGHTDDSYCFITENMLFTGDTLLIRGLVELIFKMVILMLHMRVL